MYADLHVHSVYSDGTNLPEEVVNIAVRNNVKAISLVDHDTIEGIEEFLKETEKHNILGIPGVEISTSVNKKRIHIIGYHIDTKNSELISFLDRLSTARTENTRKIFQKLCDNGKLNYSWEDVLQHHEGKVWLCSSHVFEAMKKDGKYSSWEEWPEFYYKNFSKHSFAYEDVDGFEAEDAINIIMEANGIPVVAHPKLIGDDTQIKLLISKGIKGIEVYYPAHSREDIKRYLEIAKKNELLVTGGTDWHGDLTEWNVDLGEYGVTKAEVDLLNQTKWKWGEKQ